MSSDNSLENARNALQLKEKEYVDLDAEADHVQIRRRMDDQRLYMAVNGREVEEIGRVANAFPLSAALKRVIFFDTKGEEIGCLKRAHHMDQESLNLLEEELDRAYFMPQIKSIEEISDHLGLEVWQVGTNRGNRSFEVRHPRKNLRIISPQRIIVKDVDGNRYEIRDWRMLDKKSLSLLMRHL